VDLAVFPKIFSVDAAVSEVGPVSCGPGVSFLTTDTGAWLLARTRAAVGNCASQSAERMAEVVELSEGAATVVQLVPEPDNPDSDLVRFGPAQLVGPSRRYLVWRAQSCSFAYSDCLPLETSFLELDERGARLTSPRAVPLDLWTGAVAWTSTGLVVSGGQDGRGVLRFLTGAAEVLASFEIESGQGSGLGPAFALASSPDGDHVYLAGNSDAGGLVVSSYACE
jgi:hypothetical protein